MRLRAKPAAWALLPVLLSCGLIGCHSRAAPGATPEGGAQQLAFTGFVVDQAQSLDAGTRQRLTAVLSELQHKTGHQMAVVTVTDLGGQDIATFTRNLADRWGVGRAGLNDGVVLLVAPNSQKVRIAVGQGLERILTDPFCAEVMDHDILPRFQAGKLAGGIEAGVTRISRKLLASKVAAVARAKP